MQIRIIVACMALSIAGCELAEAASQQQLAGERFSQVKSWVHTAFGGFSRACTPGHAEPAAELRLNLENGDRYRIEFDACGGDHAYLGGNRYRVPYEQLDQWLQVLPDLPQVGWDEIGQELAVSRCFGCT